MGRIDVEERVDKEAAFSAISRSVVEELQLDPFLHMPEAWGHPLKFYAVTFLFRPTDSRYSSYVKFDSLAVANLAALVDEADGFDVLIGRDITNRSVRSIDGKAFVFRVPQHPHEPTKPAIPAIPVLTVHGPEETMEGIWPPSGEPQYGWVGTAES
ncbi:MAG: hypothetical protein F4X18_13075 [Acidimicrobiia bacterium]|nr:hypothetical protein [Acidimicrobiia bacterium]